MEVKRVAAMCAIALLPALCIAEEGGSGHYLPGSMSTFIDGVPPTEAIAARLNLVYYDGAVGRGQPLPIAGIDTLNAAATSVAYGLTLAWRPPVELGGRWSYAMSVTAPLVVLKLSADVTVAGPGGGTRRIRRSARTSGLGDIVVMPLMLNYNVNPDFNMNFRVGVYTPSGSYRLGRLANTGKNFWTIEPTVGFMYFGQKNGREASVLVGTDFNGKNSATDYKSGTQFHVDGTLAQHFPALHGLAGVGLNAYYYQQMSGDSGAGARYGDFKGKTVGVGPALSFANKMAGQDAVVELKWLHETDVERRLKGEIFWFKALFKW